MINLLEKTRQSFEYLVGKKANMDVDNMAPKAKAGLFAQCHFAIVRGHGLEDESAQQVGIMSQISPPYIDHS